jgi:AcrR family transcriptional regulator
VFEVRVGTSRIEQKRERRRAEILASAAGAFRRFGYHGTSTTDIARVLGMTKGSLYYYFRDKEEMLYACHERSLDVMLAALREGARAGTAPGERLHALIRRHVEVMIDELGGSAMALEFGSLSPPLLAKVIAKRDRYERGFRAILVRGMADGTFVRTDPKLASLAILGSINWISRWFRPEGPLQAREVGEAFARFFLRGLSAGERRVRT